MSTLGGALRVQTTADLTTVDAAAWDALTGADNPFVEHAFLASLEASGSVGEGTGWRPAHLLVHDADSGALVGAAPTYVKTDSYGEFIFDWAWANASERAGLPYYPKVVVAVPFTPATGPRLLAHPEADAAAVRAALAQGARAVADAVRASSVHWLFVQPDEQEALAGHGFAARLSHQFHWLDDGFGDFDGFLSALTSKRRKEVRRERRQAAATGFDLAVEPASGLSEDDVEQLYRCYRATIDTRWSSPYLTRAWWDLLPERLGHRAVVATARDGGRLVAGALALQKGTQLYGRYWGSTVDAPALHFELCYYALIEHALAHGITRFEAGAQGSHKIQRGFLPALTYSNHWLRHSGLSEAVLEYLGREAQAVRRELDALAERSPFGTCA